MLSVKVLADEKRVIELRAAMVQKEDDHEIGLLINKTFEYDKAEAIRVSNEKQVILEAEAEKRVIARQIQLQKEEKQKAINYEKARLANKEHCAKVNRATLADLMAIAGLDEDQAKATVKAIAQNKIFNTAINY